MHDKLHVSVPGVQSPRDVNCDLCDHLPQSSLTYLLFAKHLLCGTGLDGRRGKQAHRLDCWWQAREKHVKHGLLPVEAAGRLRRGSQPIYCKYKLSQNGSCVTRLSNACLCIVLSRSTRYTPVFLARLTAMSVETEETCMFCSVSWPKRIGAAVMYCSCYFSLASGLE